MFKFTRFMFFAGVLASTAAAKAADLPPEILNNVMQTCRPDYHRVCSEVLPGGGRVGRCLMDHERELSPRCLKAIKIAYAVEVCMPDYHRYCGGTQPGTEAVVECLADRLPSLSPQCAEIVSANAPYVRPEGPRYSERRYNAPYGDHSRDRGYDYNRDAERDPYAAQPGSDRYASRDSAGELPYGQEPGTEGGYDRNGNGDRYSDQEYSAEQGDEGRRRDDE